MKTGAGQGSGTSAAVFIALYGSRGTVGPIRLEETLLAGENTSLEHGLFADASIHQFDVCPYFIPRFLDCNLTIFIIHLEGNLELQNALNSRSHSIK